MRVTSSARSRWRSAIASSRSISSSERTGATVPLCRKRSARGGSRKKKGNAPQFGLREGLFRMTGTDLTRIDGIDVMTATTVISEAGYDMSKWQTENHFVSWLRLCPDNRISGNKVIGKGRLPTHNPISIALKIAATTLRQSQTYLGAQFRRLRTKLGAPVARSEEHTSELQSPCNLVCRLLLEKKNRIQTIQTCRNQP